MRIISGKWGGRKLVPFKSNHIRPTTDRVKEAIFNILGPEVHGARVLDLFSGTGSVSFEALSRGADKVVSVDHGADAKKIIYKNAQALQVDEDWSFFNIDVFQFLKTQRVEMFDVIFIDPPFTQKIGAQVLEALSASTLFKPETLIFIEYIAHEPRLDEDKFSFYTYKKRDYKDKLMYLYKVKTDLSDNTNLEKESL